MPGVAAVAPALTLSGNIMASAPNMQSTMRKPVRPRAAQAIAGSTPLPTVPGGQITLMARNTVVGMPGAAPSARPQ